MGKSAPGPGQRPQPNLIQGDELLKQPSDLEYLRARMCTCSPTCRSENDQMSEFASFKNRPAESTAKFPVTLAQRHGTDTLDLLARGNYRRNNTRSCVSIWAGLTYLRRYNSAPHTASRTVKHHVYSRISQTESIVAPVPYARA
jgi:hypothetical protein